MRNEATSDLCMRYFHHAMKWWLVSYFGTSENFSSVLRTNGNTPKIKRKAISHDNHQAYIQIEKNPSTKPLFNRRLKHEIALLIIHERQRAISQVICFGWNLNVFLLSPRSLQAFWCLQRLAVFLWQFGWCVQGSEVHVVSSHVTHLLGFP